MSTGRPRDLIKEQQWRRWVDEQSSSGMSVRAFCSRRGLTEQSFYQWRRLLGLRSREKRLPSPPPLFVPVEVAGVVAESRIEIVLPGGQRIHVPVGFDASTLSQIVAVLEGRPC
jgi:transposase-like protein